MLKLLTTHDIFLVCSPVDMRKSITGLCVTVVEILGRNPQSQQLYLFRNKRGNQIKLLYWDKNGFCLLHKKLEKSCFKFPKKIENELMINEKEFRWLLSGFDFYQMRQYPELHFEKYF